MQHCLGTVKVSLDKTEVSALFQGSSCMISRMKGFNGYAPSLCLTSSICCSYVAASCRLSTHAYSRSLFVRRLSIDSRAYIISQHAPWPIRTPHSTCANQDAWVVITPKRPKANSIHTATWHTWTRTPPRNKFSPDTFSCLIYPSLAIVRFWFGRSIHGWGAWCDYSLAGIFVISTETNWVAIIFT